MWEPWDVAGPCGSLSDVEGRSLRSGQVPAGPLEPQVPQNQLIKLKLGFCPL